MTGELTVTLGTTTSPDPNSAIVVGTDICTIAVSNTGQGSITIDLSGTNASLYTLRNVTDGITGSSLAYDAAKSFVLETLSDFSGASYSHSATITATNDLYGNTDSENVVTSGTFTAASTFANEKYYKASTATGLTDAVRDLVLAGTNKNPFADNNNMPSLGDAFSMSFWLQVPSTASTFDPVIAFSANDTRKHLKIFHLNGKFTVGITAPLSAVDYSFSHTTYNTWQHFVITKKAVAPRNPNYDSTDYFLQVYIDGTPQNPSVSFWDNSPAFTTTLWDNESVSEVYISGPARNYGTNNAYASSKSGRQWKVDELAFYSKELSQSEVNTIYNSGTTKDLMDLNSSFNLSKYFRFGDHASDVTTTGSIECYDEVLDTVYFEDNGGTIENHGASDTPYVPASGSFSNDSYLGGSAYYSLDGVYKEVPTSSTGGLLTTYAAFDLYNAQKTISFWYYVPASTTSTYNYIFVDSDSAYNSVGLWVYQGKMYLTNYELGGRADANIAFDTSYGDATSFSDEWVQITIITGATDPRNSLFYINGLSRNTGNYSNSTQAESWRTTNTSINRSILYGAISDNNAIRPSSSSSFNTNTQKIDEFIVFDGALTSTEISDLYNGGTVFDYSTLDVSTSGSTAIRYLRFGDGASDSESSITCEINSNFVLDKNTNVTATMLTSY